MRAFILGAVVCLGALVTGASSASAQVVTYTTPYGGFSYSAAYPGTTVYPATPVYSYPYVVGRPMAYGVAPYPVVAPWYPGAYYRPGYRAYYGPAYGWRW
jgi:hypothetical protein